jgi:hypothetical protein
MKRIVLLAVGVSALVFSGLAVAHATQSHSLKAVSATFTATGVSNLRTSTCIGDQGVPFTLTRATYSGTATSSDPTLSGPIVLDLSSYLNTQTGYGTVGGKLSIATANGGHTNAGVTAVFSNNTFAGLASGRVDHATWVLANMSASFAPATGIASGNLGGSAGGAAVEGVPGRCVKPAPPKPQHIRAIGYTTAVSATSISADGVTCVVPADLSHFVTSHVAVGTRVDLKCSVAGGVTTLYWIGVRGHAAESHTVHALRK